MEPNAPLAGLHRPSLNDAGRRQAAELAVKLEALEI
jgi:hypothetical protein